MPVTLTDVLKKRDQILLLAERYRAENVRVFGSVVRGDLEPWSDIDFLVDPLPGHSLLDRAGLIIALGELLGTNVDVATYSELREFVRSHAQSEAVAI
jgi:predicted nucleotidyltransferase